MAIKVLQINAVYGVKSTGRNCHELTTGLEGNGFRFYSAYAIKSPLANEHDFLIGSRVDHKAHAFLSRLTGLQGYFSSRPTRELIKYIECVKPDVVHINNLHSNYINLGALLEYIASKDIGLVATLHDCWFFTGKCTHYTTENCHRWREHCGNCPRLKEDNRSWIFDRTSKMLEDKRKWFSNVPRLAIIGVSDWITNEARLSILKNAPIIRTIYNWIDVDVFSPKGEAVRDKVCERFGIDKSSFVILFVASEWNESKGLFRILRIVEKLGMSCKVMVIGKIRVDVHFPDTVIHIDETHDVSSLVEYYSAADVFVNLSKEETFGKVTVEAMACGTPVIVMNSTASPEIVADGCGYVVDPDSDNDVVSAIERIRLVGKLCYEAVCRNHAVNYFSKDRCVSQYGALYQEIVRGLSV